MALTEHAGQTGSRHLRLRKIPDGLFRCISSFRELEERIGALQTEQARGDAFEVFVEAYLATALVWQVADLWLVGQVPLDVRRTVNLPADAKGIDGVFRTRGGTLVPYQVKFRVGRPQVGVAEVSTFLGLTERAADRLLVSNADRYAKDVEGRDHLRLLRGTDFDGLTTEDWTAISDWIDARPISRPRCRPRPEDQVPALAAIAETLRTHARATVIMPCGTGKTLVQLWAAEQQQPQTVLVLVPSLALLGQTLDEWSRHTAWGNRFEYLCVCSDPSVSAEQDALNVRQTDVPFLVDTDPAVVRQFLGRPSTGTVRVVFSTYQSAPVVAEGLRELSPFDLGIFDEAHKTTGLHGGVFAFALDDARLPIRKRVFFTATPRHIDIRHRDREGDFRVVSMDDPTIYGPRAYTQTFADAVALGIICDYRVVVSVVDPEEVSAFALRYGITLVKGDQQATHWVANQIAISEAIAATGATKVITFHGRVKQAQVFASPTPRGIGQYLDGFIVDHVNGEQRVADRKDILSGFREPQPRLVTNARCLTEGVNLPAVDMVAFCNPRKSRVDIVQALGRAMRKPPGSTKTLGYVVVPILLAPHLADDLEQACAGTDWEDVVDVLAALRDHDARLEEEIRVLQVAKGRGEVFSPRSLLDRAQVIGPYVALEALERHISAVIVERLGLTWDQHYGQLVAFQQKHGHCYVPVAHEENGFALGRWVDKQRQRRRKLADERIRQLEAVPGWSWAPLDDAFLIALARFEEFVKREEHGLVPLRHKESGFPLGRSVNKWRTQFKADTMESWRRDRLVAAGMQWEHHATIFESNVLALETFQAQNGHLRIPEGDKWERLRLFVSNVRQRFDHQDLSDKEVAALQAVPGWTWRPFESSWEQGFAALQVFHEREHHVKVPAGHIENGVHLKSWLLMWRTTLKKELALPELSPERRSLLEQRRAALAQVPGALASPRNDRFIRGCQLLTDYAVRQGSVLPPEEYVVDDFPLGKWVRQMLYNERYNMMSKRWKARLNDVPGWSAAVRESSTR